MSCAAVNCNGVNSIEDKVFFFRFPQDLDLCKLWVICCRRLEFFKEDPASLHFRYKLCSRHFMKDLVFMKNGNAYLVNNAIPTIFDFPNIHFAEPCSIRTDDKVDEEHGYSKHSFLLPGSFDYELMTRVVEISKGKYFVCGGALLKPGSLKKTSLESTIQIGVLLGIVKNNRIQRITCDSVFSCYLDSGLLLTRPGRFWMKRLYGDFPPGEYEIRTFISREDFCKGLSIDKTALKNVEVSKKESIGMSSPPSVPNGVIKEISCKKMPLIDEPPPLSAPQSVLLLKRRKRKVTQKPPSLPPIEKPPSYNSVHSECGSPLDSLLALQCDPQNVEPVLTGRHSPLQIFEEYDEVDLESQKCLEWIEKHSSYFEKQNCMDTSELGKITPGYKECRKLIVQLSNAPISDMLKRDLVNLLAENKDKNELEAVVEGKCIRAVRQLVKIPVSSVNGGTLTSVKKQIEEALRSKQEVSTSGTDRDGKNDVNDVPVQSENPCGHGAKRLSDSVPSSQDGPSPSKKFRKWQEPSKIPAHIRNIILRNSETEINRSSANNSVQVTSVAMPLQQFQKQVPCTACLERAKEKPPPSKIQVRPLKDYPEYILLKKQLAAAKRRIHKLEKANGILKEKARNPPKIKIERVLEEIQKYLTMDAFTLVQSTVMHNAKDVTPHGHRFSDQLKNLGYRLMLSGVQVYKCFAHIFNLPCTTTMKKWISQYEKKHIDSLFGLNTNKGETIGDYIEEEEEDDEEVREENEALEDIEQQGDQTFKDEQNAEDHSYGRSEESAQTVQHPIQKQAMVIQRGQAQTMTETEAFLTSGDRIILEEGDEAYEIQENGEVAALEVILDDGEEVPLQIPIEQFYSLQQHYVIET